MNKRTYRTKNVNQINWSQVKEQLSRVTAVFAFDVAKTKQYALLTNDDASVSEGLWWNHPEQTLSAGLIKLVIGNTIVLPIKIKKRINDWLKVFSDMGSIVFVQNCLMALSNQK